jgi:DNA repair protein RadC
MMTATRINWKMVKDESYEYFREADEPEVIYDIASKILEGEAQENILVFALDVKLNVVGITNVSKGLVDASLLHAREVFRPAILANASGIILVHNHPSGDPSPSEEDHKITERFEKDGDLLDIKVVDHVIIGEESYYSFSAGRVFQKEG